jgi:predicted oxidoreductase
MQMYRIPNTDLDVSRLSYGTWHLGGSWDLNPPAPELYDRADRLVHVAIEQGINMIDLADIYTRGKSDTLIGEVLRKQPSLRDKLILQEKCGIIVGNDPNPGDPGRYDFSYDHIIGTVEASLKRLQTDHVEILLLHRPDPLVETEEIARALDDLHSSGKVRYFGVSNHSIWQIELLKKYMKQPLVINQLELNLLHHTMISEGIVVNQTGYTYTGSDGLLDYCRLNDIMIQAWSPVAGGKLFNAPGDAPENAQALSRLIAEMAQQHQTTQEAIAFAWLLRHPAKIQPIIGTMNADRLVDSCKADTVELSRIEWYHLLAAARGKSVP